MIDLLAISALVLMMIFPQLVPASIAVKARRK
jgi:hypothetical protein